MRMMELLSQADPARTIVIDSAGLRATVDERISGSVPLSPNRAKPGRPWLRAVTAFALVLAVFIPVGLLDRGDGPSWPQLFGGSEGRFGVAASIGLEGGGVKTVAVDGSTIWVMSALQRSLAQIDARSGEIQAQYPINAYVEGVAIGGGYVWLASYDDGGGLLRFDPEAGEVDMEISTEGAPAMAWFSDSLWLSTDAGSLFKVSVAGEFSPAGPGQLKGTGLGMLWIYDSQTRSIRALTEDGNSSGIEITSDSLALGGHLDEIDAVYEAYEHMWLVVGGGGELLPGVVRFNPVTGELQPLNLIPGVRSGVVFDDALWMPSYTEHLIVRLDPRNGDTEYFALPGRPGQVLLADGKLWVALYQPGALARLDVEQLLGADERIVDQTGDGSRLVCTAGSSIQDPAELPTAILDPSGWIGYASWSMVQAELSSVGIRSCAFGFLDDSKTPAERAAGLESALVDAGVEGPYLMVAAMDGVHSTRLFAEGRDDIAAVVLVDPMPVGFQTLYGEVLSEWGHPPWADIDLDVSDALGDFGDTPLVVIGQDPDRTFLGSDFRREAGAATARRLHDAWQAGLDSYQGLSSNSTRVIAADSGLDMIVWDLPDLVAREALAVLERSTGQ